MAGQINLTQSNLAYLGFWGPGTPEEMHSFTNLAFANAPAQAVQQQRYGIHSLLKSHHICKLPPFPCVIPVRSLVVQAP